MRKLCSVLFFPLAMAVLFFIAFPTYAQWTVVSPSEFIHHFRSADFVDEMHGYAVGWVDLGSGVQSLLAWTSDGGGTWKTETFNQVEINTIRFTDADHGYMAGRSYLCDCPVFERTTDGGKTWTESKFDDLVGGFEALDFIDSSYGIVGGGDQASGDGYILQTFDAGKTFNKVLDAELTHVARIDLVDRNTAFIAAGEEAGGENVIYKTVNLNDREQTVWEPVKTFEGFYLINALTFVDNNLGYATLTFFDGSSFIGEVYKTTDGGGTWNRHYNSATYTVVGMDFLDADNGFVVGSDAVILQTTDGGENWTENATFETQLLIWVDYVSPTVAYAVGTDGTIMKYTRPAGVSEGKEGKGNTMRVTVVPNPAVSVSSVVVEGGSIGTTYRLSLYNTRGEELRSVDLVNGRGEIKTEEFPKGVCFYHVMKEGSVVATGSLIVE